MVVPLAAEMDDCGPLLRPRADGELVQEPRAERAAEDEHDRRVLRQAQTDARLLPPQRLRPDRNRPADGAVLRPASPDREGEEDAVGEGRGQAVGEPEVGIGLAHRARDAAQPCGEHHRPADVAAGAEHGVRLPPVEDAEARERRPERPARGTDEPRPGPPRQPRDGKGVELVALLRNEPRLDPLRRPGERHDRAAPPQLLRHRERGRHVADRPAGRDQKPELPLVRHCHGRC